MEKKKILLNILAGSAFILLCVISVILVSYLMRPVTTSRKNVCGFYAEQPNSLDAVFVGGSICYTLWEPLEAWEQCGFTSYDFALDAMQPQVIPFILEEIAKTQSPELYVIDARPFQYGDLYNEEENVPNMERVAPFRNISDNLYYSLNRVDLIRQAAPVKEEKWTYYFDLAKYHSNGINLIQKENWQYIFNKKRLESKGFTCYEEANPIFFDDTSDVREELQLEEPVDTLFVNLLEYCRDRDLPVLFIVYPYCNFEVDQKKYNYMSRRIEEYGFDFLNCNDLIAEIGLNPEKDYYDYDHANLSGADKLTGYLAHYLQERYQLDNRKQDVTLAGWDDDYAQWSAKMNPIRAGLQ